MVPGDRPRPGPAVPLLGGGLAARARALRRATRSDPHHRARRVDRRDRDRLERRRRRRRRASRRRSGSPSRRRSGGSTSTSPSGSRSAVFHALPPGREQNEVARDAYSYLHLAMVAGIVLLALGMKKTLEHANDPLETVPAAALVGGVAMYLLAHRRLPLAAAPHARSATADRRGRTPRAPAAGGRDPCLRDRRDRGRRRLGTHRLRGRALRRFPPEASGRSSHARAPRGVSGVMEKLWAPWRLEYVAEAGAQPSCVFCDEAAGLLGETSLVIARGERAFALLNKFPYSSGHLMVATQRHVADLGELDADEAAEIHRLTVDAIAALASRLPAGRVQRRLEPRGGRRRLDLRPPPPARGPALVRGHELHACPGGREGPAGAPARDARAAPRGACRLRPSPPKR